MNGSLLLLLAILVVVFIVLRRRRRRRRFADVRSVGVGSMERNYTLHRPAGTRPGRLPLVICFHGGSGRAERFAHGSGLIEAGSRNGFIVAFPQAPDGWEDARPERGGGQRDLAFMDALLDRLTNEPDVDPARIYALGASNGGMFAMRLACERPERFAGFATVIANLPAAAAGTAPPGAPVPIMLVFGREDPIMPRLGGEIPRGRHVGVGGTVVSADETVTFWVRRNKARHTPETFSLQVGRNVEVRDYAPLPDGAAVRAVEIEGWGHRWPRWGAARIRGGGGFDIADMIWEFFNENTAGSAAGLRPLRLALGKRLGR